MNAAQDAGKLVARANLENSKEQARPLSGDQQWMKTSGGLTMSMSKKAAMAKLITTERMVTLTTNAQVTSSNVKDLATTANKRVAATATDKQVAAPMRS